MPIPWLVHHSDARGCYTIETISISGFIFVQDQESFPLLRVEQENGSYPVANIGHDSGMRGGGAAQPRGQVDTGLTRVLRTLAYACEDPHGL